MKKTLLLTALLSIGFTFQNCDLVGCKCDKLLGKYFQVTSIAVDLYKKRGSCCADKITDNQQVALSDLSINVQHSIRFYSLQPTPHSFSLIPTASACDCVDNGYQGSKQKLQSLSVITLQDFDAQHLANDTINDLLNTQVYLNTYDLNTYLRTDTAAINQFGYTLTLKKKPELSSSFRVRIDIRLKSGELFSASSSAATIQ